MKTTRLGIIGILAGVGTIPALGIELGEDMGSIQLDTRVRYESADLETLESSSAITGRIRAGYQSENMNGFNFLVELETTVPLDEGEYDAYPGAQGTAGKTIIADPKNFELNRIQLVWKGEQAGATIGRQRIIRNNARFIGNVGWRQNEQTYDAITLEAQPVDNLSLFYGFLDRAQRIFGKQADVQVQREFEMSTHLLEAQYKAGNGVTAGAYAYLLGIENSPVNASDTLGTWVSGTTPLEDGLTLLWRGELAQQQDNGDSPDSMDFSLDYRHLTAGLKKDGWGSLSIGYESLEGDGYRGFSTPLATLHAFNGFADMFLSTPSNGLTDLYLKATFPLPDGVTGTIFIHQFESEMGDVDFGEEYDFVLGYKINKNITFTAKLAIFKGEIKPDIDRLWIQLDGKF
ncbi:MAG: hypothetical protein AB3N63_04370 [Puniceicoccaceae bacterium]